MKVKVTLRFRDYCSDHEKMWNVGGSSWSSDQKRISLKDMKSMLDHALEHTLHMTAPDDDLTITIETTES